MLDIEQVQEACCRQLKRVQELREQEAKAPEPLPELKLKLACALIDLGNLKGNPFFANLGQEDDALDCYMESLKIVGGLLHLSDADVPSEKQYKEEAVACHVLASTHMRIGDLYNSLYSTKAHELDSMTLAEVHYEKALSVARQLTPSCLPSRQECKANVDAYRVLMAVLNRLGDIKAVSDESGAKELYKEALVVAGLLVPDNLPTENELRSDVNARRGLWVDYIKAGHEEACRDLWVSYIKLGGVSGDSQTSLDNYEEALMLAEAMNLANPNFQTFRDLWVSYIKLGGVWRETEQEKAYLQYKQALEVCQALKDKDPANKQVKCDLELNNKLISELAVRTPV